MSECICVLISFFAFLISIFSRRYGQTYATCRIKCSCISECIVHITSYVDFVAIDIAQQIEDNKTAHIDITLVRQKAKLLFNVAVVVVGGGNR